MCKRRAMNCWMGLISGIFILNAMAETLSPPEKKEYSTGEILEEQFALAGKIIKVRFNRIYYVSKQPNGMYTGNLRSMVTLSGNYYSDPAGIQIRFPQEGFGYISKFLPKPGVSYEEEENRVYESDSGTLYVQVSNEARPGFVAIGDQYRREDDQEEEEYRWSVKTEPPDLSDRHTVSVSDVWLFPEYLNGRTVELQFRSIGQITQTAVNEYRVSVSDGRGCLSVPLIVPPAGRAFFKEIELSQRELEGSYQVSRVYVSVTINANGTTVLTAQGRRMSGSGDSAEYRW
ncbi:MAG TPA: hypothetical protein PKI68_04485 [Pontiellaceae bacterium]|nr:hypothetical protein [Pontiellaceae bacterium]